MDVTVLTDRLAELINATGIGNALLQETLNYVIKFLRVAARWWVRFRLSDAIGKGGYNLTTELIGSEDYFRIAD
jgi:hypothetical protein